jgi:hypothetical protein
MRQGAHDDDDDEDEDDDRTLLPTARKSQCNPAAEMAAIGAQRQPPKGGGRA